MTSRNDRAPSVPGDIKEHACRNGFTFLRPMSGGDLGARNGSVTRPHNGYINAGCEGLVIVIGISVGYINSQPVTYALNKNRVFWTFVSLKDT